MNKNSIFVLLALVLTISALKLNQQHLYAPLPFPVGTKLTPNAQSKPFDVTINYKYGSFLGAGGDQAVTFTVFSVDTPKGQVKLILMQMPLFVQKDGGFPLTGPRTVNSKDFAYGFSNNFYFLVQLNATRKSHGIYQWRFLNALGKSTLVSGLGVTVLNGLQGAVNSKVGSSFDVTALFGDPLRTF